MADVLEDAITALGDALDGMTGLARWHSDPPESLSEFPCGMAFAVSGEINAVSAGFNLGFHTVRIAIYLARAVLPEAVDAAKVWPYLIFNALIVDPTLGGTVQTLRPPTLTYRCGPLAYGSETLFGVTVDVTLKI